MDYVDAGRRLFHTDIFNESDHSFGDGFLSAAVDVVRAGHHEDVLGGEAVQLLVHHTPHHIPETVPAVAAVDDVAVSEYIVPGIHTRMPDDITRFARPVMGYGVADHHDLRIRGDVPFPVKDSGMSFGPVVECEITALPQRSEDVREVGCRAEGVEDRLKRGHRVRLCTVNGDEVLRPLAFFPAYDLHREVSLPLNDVPYRLGRPVNSLDRNIVERHGFLHRDRLEMEIGSATGSDLHPFHLIVKRKIKPELVAVPSGFTVIHTERERYRVTHRLSKVAGSVQKMESSIVVNVEKIHPQRCHLCGAFRNIPALKHVTYRDFRSVGPEINVPSVKSPAGSERPFCPLRQRIMPNSLIGRQSADRNKQCQTARRHRTFYDSRMSHIH